MERAIPAAEHAVDYDVAIEVATHEALIRQTYKDSRGILTWCVGMTNATGHTVERYIGKPASLSHCMRLYAWALSNYAEQVKQAFGRTKLTKAQFAAAVSFHWNTGKIRKASWVKSFIAGDVDAARRQFMLYRKPAEIIERREKERDLFFDGKWSNNGTMPEYVRLTSRMTPVWSSRIRTDVSAELKAAFARIETPVLDAAPKPDNKPAAPTLSPPKAEPDAGGALMDDLAEALDETFRVDVPAKPAPKAEPRADPKKTPVTGRDVGVAGSAGLVALLVAYRDVISDAATRLLDRISSIFDAIGGLF